MVYITFKKERGKYGKGNIFCFDPKKNFVFDQLLAFLRYTFANGNPITATRIVARLLARLMVPITFKMEHGKCGKGKILYFGPKNSFFVFHIFVNFFVK